jgi:hypothetical protein
MRGRANDAEGRRGHDGRDAEGCVLCARSVTINPSSSDLGEDLT